ncbi:ABC transporter ATP-binding protein [Actinomadura opuntiae]|uniref:ABC transporter ATP-binding protein n=1 Tax=Actinomadura sp. OS1-43 TaxID=604315 RepID=UPI00255A937A|nr:ABC transporter ATP-binding protein [Actinomadura sp. OS1-43]MDL4812675.1 ABC transporter ATP-binding protein [Actinomadura sp. OS1-43]
MSAAPSEAALSVDGLYVTYGRVEALHGVSLTVGPAEVVALLGANGAGKTSLLRAVSGAVRARGTVQVYGRKVTGMPGHRIAALGVGHVPEGRGTFVDLTVEENLRLGVMARRRSAVGLTLEQALELYPELAGFRARKAGALSGGQQQMLALARALLAAPRLLLIDEPSTGLAPLAVAEVYRTIASLCARHSLAVLLAEQNVTRALEVADRAYVLGSGMVAAEGAASDLAGDPAVQAAYLGTDTGGGDRP